MFQHRSYHVLGVGAALAALLLALGSCALFQGTGTITGIVYDSTASGAGLAGVTVTVLRSSYSATTDAAGGFTVTAPATTVTLHFAKTGYSFTDVTMVVTRDQQNSMSQDVVGYLPLTSGQYRFVLTWGSEPSDIDSHLFMPLSGGGTDEVYYSHKVSNDGRANLDWDDTTSYGPETTTIDTVTSGTYTYSIYNYSGSPDMGTTSNAVVQVYDSSGLLKTLKIVDATGASPASGKLWWKVFTFNGDSRTFSWINQMSDTGN